MCNNNVIMISKWYNERKCVKMKDISNNVCNENENENEMIIMTNIIIKIKENINIIIILLIMVMKREKILLLKRKCVIMWNNK